MESEERDLPREGVRRLPARSPRSTPSGSSSSTRIVDRPWSSTTSAPPSSKALRDRRDRPEPEPGLRRRPTTVGAGRRGGARRGPRPGGRHGVPARRASTGRTTPTSSRGPRGRASRSRRGRSPPRSCAPTVAAATCRDCRLALADHHPNVFVVEPEGRDIHVDTIREEVWQPASRTAPEPGRKVFLVREADRLSPAAADTLLKVLEEPPADTVSPPARRPAPTSSRRPSSSRCHVVTFAALSGAVRGRAAPGPRASTRGPRAPRRAATGGNLGRARRLGDRGRRPRVPRHRASRPSAPRDRRPAGALQAADARARGGRRLQEGPRGELDDELAPVPRRAGAARGRYRGAISRIEVRFQRRSDGRSATTSTGSCSPRRAILRDRVPRPPRACPATSS